MMNRIEKTRKIDAAQKVSTKYINWILKIYSEFT